MRPTGASAFASSSTRGSRLLLGFLLFAVVAMALLDIPVGYTLNSNDRSSTLVALRRDTSALATVLANDIGRHRIGQAGRVARTYSRTTGRQILVLEGAKTLIASKQRQLGDQEIAGIVQRVRRPTLGRDSAILNRWCPVLRRDASAVATE